jgi:hypothetical protein
MLKTTAPDEPPGEYDSEKRTWSRPEKKPILALLVKRTVFFFFIMCVLTVFLYGIGTVREFMDTTQEVLLRLAAVFGFLLAVGAVYGIGVDLWFILYKGKYRFFLGVGGYAALGIFGILVAAAATFIVVISGGNGP